SPGPEPVHHGAESGWIDAEGDMLAWYLNGREIEERPGIVDGEAEHLAVRAIGCAGLYPEDICHESSGRSDIPRQHGNMVDRDPRHLLSISAVSWETCFP